MTEGRKIVEKSYEKTHEVKKIMVLEMIVILLLIIEEVWVKDLIMRRIRLVYFGFSTLQLLMLLCCDLSSKDLKMRHW